MAYKRLASDAKEVARMGGGELKIKRAKDIERRYYDLIERAKREQA